MYTTYCKCIPHIVNVYHIYNMWYTFTMRKHLQYVVYFYNALCTNVCQIYYMWYAFNMWTTYCTFSMYTTHCKCM